MTVPLHVFVMWASGGRKVEGGLGVSAGCLHSMRGVAGWVGGYVVSVLLPLKLHFCCVGWQAMCMFQGPVGQAGGDIAGFRITWGGCG